MNPAATVVSACPHNNAEYFILVEGDGAPLRLAAGAAVVPFKIRSCEPAAYYAYLGLVVAACAETPKYQQSCIWISEKSGIYVDERGVDWKLSVVRRSLSETAAAVRGDVVAVGRSRSEAKQLVLRIKVDVGRDIPAISAPDIYPRTAWSDD